MFSVMHTTPHPLSVTMTLSIQISVWRCPLTNTPQLLIMRHSLQKWLQLLLTITVLICRISINTVLYTENLPIHILQYRDPTNYSIETLSSIQYYVYTKIHFSIAMQLQYHQIIIHIGFSLQTPAAMFSPNRGCNNNHTHLVV